MFTYPVLTRVGSEEALPDYQRSRLNGDNKVAVYFSGVYITSHIQNCGCVWVCVCACIYIYYMSMINKIIYAYLHTCNIVAVA